MKMLEVGMKKYLCKNVRVVYLCIKHVKWTDELAFKYLLRSSFPNKLAQPKMSKQSDTEIYNFNIII